jgi:SAM-dependent methyltransferase
MDHTAQVALSAATIGWYEENAHDYASRTQELDGASGERAWLIGELGPGASILDAGCGAGRDLKAFAQAGLLGVGLEPSPSLAEIARKASGCDVIEGTFADIPRGRRFDAAWCCASLLHMPRPDTAAALSSLRDSLRPGGLLVAIVKKGKGASWDGRRLTTFFEEEEISAALKSAGFRETHTTASTGSSAFGESVDWIVARGRR